MANPVLRLYLPPQLGTGFVEDFTAKAEQYRHRIVDNGGYWMAEWWFPLAPAQGIAESYLKHWFDAHLMHKVVEAGAGVTWEGVVWQMELNLDGLRKIRTMDKVYNAVKVTYTNEDGDLKYTDWQTSADSIRRYGRREKMESITGLTGPQAAAMAQRILSQTLRPLPITAGVDVDDEGLRVTAAGFVKTAENKFVGDTTLDGTDISLDTFVRRIIANDCEFLSAGIVEANSITRKAMTDQPMTAWELLREIVQVGDSNNDPRFFRVYNDARAHYLTPSTNPTYRWYGKQKRLGDSLGGDVLWKAKPAVMRDMTADRGAPPPGSWLADAADTWIPEVEARAGSDIANLKPDEPDPEAVLRKKEQILKWQELGNE